jgi:hypothetical protein
MEKFDNKSLKLILKSIQSKIELKNKISDEMQRLSVKHSIEISKLEELISKHTNPQS